MKKAIILSLFAAFLIGCKTVEYIPVEKVKIEYRDKLERDSIYINDSVYIRDKGDTVYFEKWYTKYIEKLRVDSIVRIDSIPVPYPVEKIVKVEKDFSWWQRLRMTLGGIFIIVIILGAAYLGLKNKTKLLSIIRKIVGLFS